MKHNAIFYLHNQRLQTYVSKKKWFISLRFIMWGFPSYRSAFFTFFRFKSQGIDQRKLRRNLIELWLLELPANEVGKDIHSRSIFSQFQTVIKFELIRIPPRRKRDPFRIGGMRKWRYRMKQNNLTKCKLSIEMAVKSKNGGQWFSNISSLDSSASKFFLGAGVTATPAFFHKHI